jgi:hypothetical protein
VLGSGFVLGALAETVLAGAPPLGKPPALAAAAAHAALAPRPPRSAAPKVAHAPGLLARAGLFARGRRPADARGDDAGREGHGRPGPGGEREGREGRERPGPGPAKPPAAGRGGDETDGCDARSLAAEGPCDGPPASDGTCPPADPSDLLYYVNRWFAIPPRYPVSSASIWTPCAGPLYGVRHDLVCLPVAYSYGANALRRVAFESPAPAAPALTYDGRPVGFRGKVGFRALLDAAREEAGFSVYVRSGFRPFATQAAVFRRWVSEEQQARRVSYAEALARAATTSAREGHSEHQLGTTADLIYRTEKGPVYEGWSPETIAHSPAMTWVHENAHRFGIVLTYERDKERVTQYQWEPWHYRFVGVAAADTMRRCRLSTEEYLNARYGIGPLPRHDDAARLFDGAPPRKGG